MWQVAQPRSVKSLAPSSAMEPVGLPPASQVWNAPGSIAVTLPIIREWLMPQYSAQNSWYSPGFEASNHIVVVRPGTASIFMRKAGTQ